MTSSSESSELRVRVGETFDIPLEGTPTTGFRWDVSLPPGAEGQVALLEEEMEASADRVGGPAVQRFRFRASTPGDVVLTFRYARPWENREPREERVFVVRIAA